MKAGDIMTLLVPSKIMDKGVYITRHRGETLCNPAIQALLASKPKPEAILSQVWLEQQRLTMACQSRPHNRTVIHEKQEIEKEATPKEHTSQ